MHGEGGRKGGPVPPTPCVVQRHCIGVYISSRIFFRKLLLKSRDLENIGLNDTFSWTISTNRRKYLEFSTKLCMFSCNIMMRNIAHSISSTICKLTVVFAVSLLTALKRMIIFSINLIEVSDVLQLACVEGEDLKVISSGERGTVGGNCPNCNSLLSFKGVWVLHNLEF